MNDHRFIVKSTSSLIVLTIFVKLCGIIKQSVIAYYFGTNSEMDMYFIASDFVAEIGIVFFSALMINLVNLYLEEKEAHQKGSNIFTDTTVVFVLLSVAVSLVISIFPGHLARVLAPGAAVESISRLILYLRLFCFALACVAVSNICTAVLNAERDFLPGKCVGFIQSVCVIVCCILLYKKTGILSLIIGTLLFFIIEDIFLLIKVKKYVWFKRPHIFNNNKIKELIKLWIPLFLSNSVVQLNAIIDKAIATSIGEGNVSALSYGHFVFTSIHSIIIMNICTVLFAYFSAYLLDNKMEELITTFRSSLSLVVFIMIPIMVLCVCESEYIVKILYGRGAFSEQSVALTNNALVGYAVGIVFLAIRDIIMQVFYALKKNQIAMINGVIGVIINIILSMVLSKRIGVFGIAVADGIAYLLVAIFSCVEIKYEIKNIWNIQVMKSVIPSVIFTFISVIPLLFVKKLVHANAMLHLLFESGCFILCFILSLIITKNDSIKRFIEFIK